MAIDPVSGEQVQDDSTWFTEYEGDTFYFTSKENKVDFDQAPAHFAERAQADRGKMDENTYPTRGVEEVEGDDL